MTTRALHRLRPARIDRPAASDVLVHLLPAVARQATIAVSDPAGTSLTARVVAEALDLLGQPSRVVAVEVATYPRGAWEAGAEALRVAGGPGDSPYLAVESDGVLIDASLDLLAVPSAGMSLRPSWFSLPGGWDRDGTAVFGDQRGAVVSYRRLGTADIEAGSAESDLLALRLAEAVADLCRRSAGALAGVDRTPRRWTPVAQAA